MYGFGFATLGAVAGMRKCFGKVGVSTLGDAAVIGDGVPGICSIRFN